VAQAENIDFPDVFVVFSTKRLKKHLFFGAFLLEMLKKHRYFDDFPGDDWRESRDSGAESVGYIGGDFSKGFQLKC